MPSGQVLGDISSWLKDFSFHKVQFVFEILSPYLNFQGLGSVFIMIETVTLMNIGKKKMLLHFSQDN